MTENNALPMVKTFDYGGVPQFRFDFLRAKDGADMSRTLMRSLHRTYPDLVHPDAPQLKP